MISGAAREITTEQIEPCGCDGTGRIQYIDREPENTRKPLGDGLYAGPSTTHGTLLCECRRALEPRDGEATWWSSKLIYEAEWDALVFEPHAEVSVMAEVPISADNYVLHRTRENAYWPCSVAVDLSDPEMHWLFPDEARELARLLIEAADAADAYDNLPEVAA
jgi:hypothetical protein